MEQGGGSMNAPTGGIDQTYALADRILGGLLRVVRFLLVHLPWPKSRFCIALSQLALDLQRGYLARDQKGGCA